MNKLFADTQAVADALVAHGVPVVEVEPHDAEDPEHPDRIWLKRYSDGGMCEGEYIFVRESRYKDSDRVDLYVGTTVQTFAGAILPIGQPSFGLVTPKPSRRSFLSTGRRAYSSRKSRP